MTGRIEPHDAAVRPAFGIPPPLVGLALIGAGLTIAFVVPQPLFQEGWVPLTIGLPLVALGISLAARSVQTFRRARTDERYAEPTRVIVQHGPYTRTRNPMMLSLVLIHAGVLLAANAGWGLVMVPILILYLHLGVILREEHYLKARFGDEYESYAKRVPRWIPRLKTSPGSVDRAAARAAR